MLFRGLPRLADNRVIVFVVSITGHSLLPKIAEKLLFYVVQFNDDITGLNLNLD